MNALFGESRANQLRVELEALTPQDRELRIVEELSQAIGAANSRYVLPFRFRSDQGTRTSHHLIFVSKHFKGYEIMKQVMAKESTSHDQGVPSFEYNPADKRFLLLFELTRPLDELEDMLMEAFSGRSAKMHDVYLEHNVGRRFIERNYKDALMSLETKRLITCDPPASTRRAGTMGPNTLVSFPRAKANNGA
jgi:hypothetical protein